MMHSIGRSPGILEQGGADEAQLWHGAVDMYAVFEQAPLHVVQRRFLYTSGGEYAGGSSGKPISDGVIFLYMLSREDSSSGISISDGVTFFTTGGEYGSSGEPTSDGITPKCSIGVKQSAMICLMLRDLSIVVSWHEHVILLPERVKYISRGRPSKVWSAIDVRLLFTNERLSMLLQKACSEIAGITLRRLLSR